MIIQEEGADIILAPSVTSQYLKYSEALANFGITFRNTEVIGYFEADVIAARKYPGKIAMFAFIHCYSNVVWGLIAVSILILSFLSSINEQFLINSDIILRSMFTFIVILVKQPYERSWFRSKMKKLLIIWLLMAFVLSNQFCVYLMDFMIRAVPVVRIDTMEELSQQKDMKIVVRYDDSFAHFVNLKDTPLKQSLSQQLQTYEIIQDVFDDLIRGLRNGTLANVNKRDMLIFNMLLLSDLEKLENNEPRLVDLLHFSEKTDFYEPYFILYNDAKDWLKSNLDKMYVR